MKVSDLPPLFRQAFSDANEPRGILWSYTVNGLVASHLVPARVRTLILRALGIDVSLRALIRPRVIIRDRNLSLGPSTTINYDCVFDNRAGVTIGRSVGVGIGVKFLNTDHDIGDPGKRAGESRTGTIVVGDGTYIGSGVIILPGVSIGQGVVIAAGAVVTRDCASHCLYAGVPARMIRRLSDGS